MIFSSFLGARFLRLFSSALVTVLFVFDFATAQIRELRVESIESISDGVFQPVCWGSTEPIDPAELATCDAVLDRCTYTFAQMQAILNSTSDVKPATTPDGRIRICFTANALVVNPPNATHGTLEILQDNISITPLGGTRVKFRNHRSETNQYRDNSVFYVENTYGLVLEDIDITVRGPKAIGVFVNEGSVDLIDGFTFKNFCSSDRDVSNFIWAVRLKSAGSTIDTLRNFHITLDVRDSGDGIYAELAYTNSPPAFREISNGIIWTRGAHSAINLAAVAVERISHVLMISDKSLFDTYNPPGQTLHASGSSVGIIENCTILQRSDKAQSIAAYVGYDSDVYVENSALATATNNHPVSTHPNGTGIITYGENVFLLSNWDGPLDMEGSYFPPLCGW